MKRKLPTSQKYQTSHISLKKLHQLWWRFYDLLDSENQIWLAPPNIPKLCKLFDTNQKYLSQAINQATGLTITSLFHCYRVEAFLEKLENGEAKIKTIEGLMNEVGFQNRSSFYRAFRCSIGKQPTELMSIAK